MSRDPLLYLDDLIASAQKVARLTAGKSLDSFVANEASFDAVLFNLQVVGESVKMLPGQLRSRFSPAHQSAPARMRDLIAHHYFAVDPGIVWDVARQHLPALLLEALALREEIEQGPADQDVAPSE